MKTKIIAHRGDGEHYPENTMVAFRSAVDKGVDKIELDVHVSQDEKLIVHHDYNLGTTDSGNGLISQKKSDYIKSLDAGSWFAKEFSHEHIPFLDEVFEEFGNTTEYEIELKGYTLSFLVIILELVKKYGLLNQIEFTSPHVYVLSQLKEKEPNARIGSFITAFPPWMTRELGQEISKGNAKLGQINVVHCPLPMLSAEFVQEWQELGMQVHVANCDTENDIKKALTLKTNQLSTNKVDLALAIRRSFGE